MRVIVFFQPTMSVLATRGTMFDSSLRKTQNHEREKGKTGIRERKNGDTPEAQALKQRHDPGPFPRLYSVGPSSP